MAFKLPVTPARTVHNSPCKNPNLILPSPSSALSNHHQPRRSNRFFATSLHKNSTLPSNLCLTASRFHGIGFVTARIVRGQELTEDEDRFNQDSEEVKDELEMAREGDKKELADQSIWSQMKEIAVFTGPATGLWICGPLMSLIDTELLVREAQLSLLL